MASEGGRKLGKKDTLGNTAELRQSSQHLPAQFSYPGHYGEPNVATEYLNSCSGKSEV